MGHGNHVEAASLFSRAISASPTHANALVGLGTIKQAEGRNSTGRNSEEALELYRRALEARPGHVEATSNIGSLLFERGDRLGAEAMYRKVLVCDCCVRVR